MTDRFYRTLLGFFLLVSLYLESPELIYGITAMLLLEGISNFRLPTLVCRIRQCTSPAYIDTTYSQNEDIYSRFSTDAERIWRLLVGFLLLATYYFHSELWFFPWFLGFAIFGAGVSGVCPALLAIRWTGFKQGAR